MSYPKLLFSLFFILFCNTATANELDTPIIVQVSTYEESHLTNARNEQAIYQEQGYDAYLILVLNPTQILTGKHWFLRVGPFKDSLSATQFTSQVAGIDEIHLWKPFSGSKITEIDQRMVNTNARIYTIKTPTDTTSTEIVTADPNNNSSDALFNFDTSGAFILDDIVIDIVIDSFSGYPKIEPEFYDQAEMALIEAQKKRTKRARIISMITSSLMASAFTGAGYYYNRKADELYDAYLQKQVALPASDFDQAWKEIENHDKKRNLCYTLAGTSAGLFSCTFFIRPRNNKKKRGNQSE